ncbi:hypothetical protein BGZ63DRAFT_464892 [Mariannaea sp. PMI_226]|nr:hypothetical protein BGZ63DRAFT_464892 [Mariannaea sp. PMI_226]
MVASHLLAGLAIAAPAMALSTVTQWFPNLAWIEDTPPIWGSVVAVNDQATTVHLNCAPAWHNPPACAMYNHLTVVYGPSTVAFTLTDYHVYEGVTQTDGPLIETATCRKYPLSAVCVDSFTDSGGESPWTDIGTQTWSNAAITHQGPHVFTITSNIHKPTSTHHESSKTPTAPEVTTPFPSSTAPAATTPFTSYGTPGVSSSIQNPGFPFNTTTTPTRAGSGSHPESTSPAEVPVSGGHSLSVQQHPVMIGIAALVGAAVVFM